MLRLRFFRAPSSRDAIDDRDKNERGEDFNLSRQTGKERPCAGSSRARSRQFASHRPACGPKSSASISWNARRPSPAEALAMSAPMSGSPRAPPSPSIRPTIATAVITDLAQAPRNPDGKVEATTDVVILRPADRRARQRHAAAGRAQSRPQARAATVRRFIAARREQRARRRRRRHRLPAPPGLHDGVGRLAGRHSLQARADGADGAGAEGRDRAGARGIRLRHHDKSRAGNPDLARGRSRQPHHHRSRRLGRRAPDAVRPLGPPRRSRHRRDHAARRFRCRRALRDHLHGARSGAARHGLCRGARCRELPAPRCDAGQSAAQRPASVRQPRDRLRRLAIRPLPARLPPSRLQRGSRRAASCSTA